MKNNDDDKKRNHDNNKHYNVKDQRKPLALIEK